MRYFDLAEDILRSIHGGDIPSNSRPSMEDAIIAVAEAVPHVIYEDYKDRYRVTGELNLTADAFTTFKNVEIFEDKDTNQRYALLPFEPAIISKHGTPVVEYMQDRQTNFIYRSQTNRKPLERLGVAQMLGDVPFWFERVGWENRLVFGTELSDCAKKLKVSMVIASVDPNCIDRSLEISLPGRLINLVKDFAKRQLAEDGSGPSRSGVDETKEDKFNDNQ